ncbi:MAG: hypothetical protein EOP09_05565 [Proteobacteria bacterium]|nr:MAG: hypothetical protein EOP09_05565 [Pseudomonadota bacterium]
MDPGSQVLSNEELAILLLSGSQKYNLTAVRCAAQLLRSPDVDPKRLAFLAIKEKSERPLRHIAWAGLEHDPEGRPFWESVLDRLGQAPPRVENDLPHWTRFVSMPGYQRGKVAATKWLVPQR